MIEENYCIGQITARLVSLIVKGESFNKSERKSGGREEKWGEDSYLLGGSCEGRGNKGRNKRRGRVVIFSRSNNAKFSRAEEGLGLFGRIRCRLLTLVLQTRSTPTLSVNVGSCQNIKRFRSPGLSRTSKDVGQVETFGFSVSVNGNIIIRRYGKQIFKSVSGVASLC